MSHQEQLARVYSQIGVPLDRLPYSKDMDRVVASLSATKGNTVTCHEVWRELVNLRKCGKLPKVGRLQKPTQ
jgi:hypothetical protein